MALLSRLRLVAPLLALPAAALLLAVNPLLVRLLLPFREILLVLCALQVALSAVSLWRGRTRSESFPAGRMSKAHWTAGLLALVAVGLVIRTEYAIAEQTVAFSSHGARLVGTLYPGRDSGDQRAAIVLVHGSGKFPRRVYRYWAQRLAALGFDVLVYDKRGVGESGGVYEGENNTSMRNLQLLADDASAAVTFLASAIPGVKHVGLFGVSQGGWVAPLAAERNPRVKFLVLHSGPVVPVGQQNLYERLTGGGHRNAYEALAEAESKSLLAPNPGFDPIPVLQRLDVTALWLFGGADRNVPVQNSVSHLQQLIHAGKPFEYHVFAGADHLILTTGTRFSPRPDEYWNTLAAWMRRHKDRAL